ncbi:hypothetical protein [Nostoc sp.]|uniref:hypothetical protein n=1 Tax=Nostoc sp. TaxID=1180 RepID=UPI002FFCD2F0
MLKTGIFQLLPYSAYHPQMNNFQNRLSASVSELDLFPSLDEAKGGFSLSLSPQLLGVGFAPTSTLLYETLLYETLREQQAQGIALCERRRLRAGVTLSLLKGKLSDHRRHRLTASASERRLIYALQGNYSMQAHIDLVLTCHNPCGGVLA